jgi:hypothetical protein
LYALVSHLPPESAYRRATGQFWSDELELAAAQVETLHALALIVLRVAGAKHVPKPLRVPRPGDPSKRRAGRAVSLRELAANPSTLMRPDR